jgi:pimeloyl-ACP methyl ester carboxylesterase
MSTKQKKRSKFSCCGCFSTIFIGVIVLVLVIGPLLQVFAAPLMHESIAKTYPAPGQLYEVDGAKMHIYCEGEGSQTVIIINDPTYQSLVWRDVQAKLAKDASVCIYDRLGRGWSDVTARKRSVENIADELDGLVTAAGIKPGFILVGDREGTIYARMFAWRHPGQAGALLLVNEANETPDMYASLMIPVSLLQLSVAPLSTFTWTVGKLIGKDYIKTLKHDCLPWMDDSICNPWLAWKADGYGDQTAAFERFAIPAGWRSLLEPQVQYGDLPIVILTEVVVGKGEVYADLLKRTTNGRTQVVDLNGLGVILDKSPQSIVDAVKALLR